LNRWIKRLSFWAASLFFIMIEWEKDKEGRGEVENNTEMKL
jgi:hypothetical protein